MFGINAGYDSRPMATGRTDTGVTVTGRNTVVFQQAAAGLEAVSELFLCPSGCWAQSVSYTHLRAHET